MPKMTIYASKDTFVCSDPGYEKLNFGKQLNLILSDNYKALIYFDLSSIPANATIINANLQLYLYRFHRLDNPSIDLKQLKTDFAENTVTSATAPISDSLAEQDTPDKSIANDDLNTFITFNNLTNTVKSWYTSASTNHGFQLSTFTDSVLSFFTRENSEQDLQPKLEIEYTIDMPFIETLITNEIIYQHEDLPYETTVSDISKTLFFNYFIDNSIPNSFTNDPPDIAYVSLKTCNTKNGIFENLGEELTIDKGETTSIEVSSINKFVKLSIKGTYATCLSVSKIYKSFTTMLPAIVQSSQIVGDKIILTMTKPLTGTTADKKAFPIIVRSIDSNQVQPSTVIETLISGTTVTLVCSEDSFFIDDLFLVSVSYLPTGNADLTGIDGDVLSFTDLPLEISTPTVFLERLNFLLLSEAVKTTVWDIFSYKSKVQTFKYIINLAQDTTYNVLVSLQGSDSITGDFFTISEIPINSDISKESTFVIAISSEFKYQYVRLLITPITPNSQLSLFTIYTAFPDFIPSKIIEGQDAAIMLSTGDKIILEMTKSLNSSGNPTAFTTSSSDTNLKIQNILISNQSLKLTLNRPIKHEDLTPNSDFTNFSLSLSYFKTGVNNVTGPNGDIDNFSNQNLLLNIEPQTIKQQIKSVPDGIKTTVFDTSKALKSTYTLSTLNYTGNESDDLDIKLQECATKNGEFANVETSSIIFSNHTATLNVPKIHGYICLLVADTATAKGLSLNVDLTYACLTTDAPSVVVSGKIVPDGTKIELTMTKRMIAIAEVTTTNAFFINYESTKPDTPSNVIKLTVSRNIVTLEVSPPLTKEDSITLTYKGTETNALADKNGAIDNFTDQLIAPITP